MRKRWSRSGFVAGLIFLLLGGVAGWGGYEPVNIPPRELDGEGDRYTVYRIELREGITAGDVPFFIHRAVVAAKAAKAYAIIVDMDTPGGRLDLMMQIRDELISLDIPTYTFVNTHALSAGSLIAIATDRIVMAPISSIGAAQVISATGQEIPESVERKITSALKSEVRATAKAKGYPVRICEAFVDRQIEIPGVSPKGEVLTLDQEQATRVGGPVEMADGSITTRTVAAFIAKNPEELLKHDKMWPADILSYTMSWSEKMAKYLMRIKPLLLLVGLFAFFIEFKTPGVGVPAAVGILAFALFFWGAYLADLASVVEVVLFVLGLVLLALEIFVIPGFGVAGVTGVFLVVVSLVMSMMKLPPPDIEGIGFNVAQLKRSVWTVVGVVAALIPLMALLVHYMPGLPVLRHLVLSPDEVQAVTDEEERKARHVGLSLEKPVTAEAMMGKTGEAITDLRPAGIASFGGRRIDVMTEGEYVEHGREVRITSIHGSVTVVEEVPGQDDEDA